MNNGLINIYFEQKSDNIDIFLINYKIKRWKSFIIINS